MTDLFSEVPNHVTFPAIDAPDFGCEKFWKFHRDNPRVYFLFKKFTFQVIRSGRQYFSIDAIWQQIRWHTTIETTDTQFKLNDSHRSFYGRLFVVDYPEHKEFFRFRKSKANQILNKVVEDKTK